MFGRRVRIFKLFDFQVHVDASWVFIFLLVTWSLARGYFPARYLFLSPAEHWAMGISGALGLFFSIVFHELSHSLVARRFGLPIKGITLFVFGGVAEMEEEPSSARAEFWMAVAGPSASIVLGFVFFALYALSARLAPGSAVTGVLQYLGWINWILAVFNLVPAFPLDGGRILRSALWQWKKDLRWATRISSRAGAAFGFALSLAGIFFFFTGAFIAGLWYFLIGMFLQNAAHASYQRLIVLRALEGESVRHFMKPDPVTVPDTISIASLVEEYIYKYHFKFFPVVRDTKLIGCISTQEVKQFSKDQWPSRRVSEALKPCDAQNAIGPGEEAVRALAIMNKAHKSRMMVVEKGRLLGMITLKDLLKFISLKLDLEGEGA